MPPPNNKDKAATTNPHAAAAGAYGASAQKHTPDQRELEAHVLLKSAKFLQDLQNDWDNVTPDILEETLKYNRQIWMLFYDTALENPEGDRPNDLRSNIINLANFIFKRELEIMSKPEKEKLSVIININREIAAGLMEKQKKNSAPAPASPQDTKKPPEGGTSQTA
ncbi:MAG: flagellar FlaF family protein [Alphaproteobacteria bacterium]|nr:flagellar FlaF family protein [Alphaproteobacteria bacterium]NCQ87575.1 flagellar FlaF family protein [Alphaproteobacteria bacterium]NCT06444.1 flagellar FlaF family protein [Alphaproteobacteria bacterium]